jgi:hypothetical protein
VCRGSSRQEIFCALGNYVAARPVTIGGPEVFVTFDPGQPREISVTAIEPNDDIRILKAGFLRITADATILGPL